MKRREFITLLGGAAAWPLVARAQQPALPVIGFLHSASPDEWTPYVTAFRDGLRESGLVDGQNVAIEFRWAENQDDRLPALAAELVRRRVAVIVSNTSGSLAAKAATTTIPIVFTVGADPIRLGLVASLNRPGGNATGVNWFSTDVDAKRLGLLHDTLPQASVFAALVSPTFPEAENVARNLQQAARTLEKQLRILNASTATEIDGAFATLTQSRADGLVVSATPLFTARRDQIIALANRHRLPAIYAERESVLSGGLMSYSASATDAYRRAGMYAGRVLKGERPADLPVDRSTRFELVVNLKTAKALGLTVPPTLVALADEIIE
jgi:putative ABC transport system substrate-binding protein